MGEHLKKCPAVKSKNSSSKSLWDGARVSKRYEINLAVAVVVDDAK